MRSDVKSDGALSVRAIAGTYNVVLIFDLAESARAGCLGFSIERTDLDSGGQKRWLPNMLRFPSDKGTGLSDTAHAPLQTFRWGDYTVLPGHHYSYRVVARSGSPASILAAAGGPIAGGVTVQVTTEDVHAPETGVFFNRGAAASKAYNDKFGDKDPTGNRAALDWLSRGLREAIVDYLGQAKAGDGLHAAIYEFQFPEFLGALAAAKARGVDVQVVYHAREKKAPELAADKAERKAAGKAMAAHEAASTEPGGAAAASPDAADDADAEGGGTDKTRAANEAAIKAAGLDKLLGPKALVARDADPQGAIMHNKFVVWLRGGKPQQVLTGSTNWTDGALYGQLNVGHVITEQPVAQLYEQAFQRLLKNPNAHDSKSGNAASIPASADAIPQGITPIFSPQTTLDMIDLYAMICARAKVLFVSAPFLLHEKIRDVLDAPTTDALRYVLADREGSFGKKGTLDVINGNPGSVGVVATMLRTSLNDFQGKLLEARESFHHAGVHVHTKIILADPLSDDPILVGGSANFSNGSTTVNDSNSMIVRGRTAISDIYGTEFLRMFEHYLFRFKQSKQTTAQPLCLSETTDWQTDYYDPKTTKYRERTFFMMTKRGGS